MASALFFASAFALNDTTATRRLEWVKFKDCWFDKKMVLHMGVILDGAAVKYIKKRKMSPKKYIQALWKRASKPFEKQFNFRIEPTYIRLASEFGIPDVKCGPKNKTKWYGEGGPNKKFRDFRENNRVGQKAAGWVYQSGCFIGPGGHSVFDTMGKRKKAIAYAVLNRDAISHEIGHMMNADHTFYQKGNGAGRHNRTKGSNKGVMDYSSTRDPPTWKGKFQFHRMHEPFMCMRLNILKDKSNALYAERWREADEQPPPDVPPPTTEKPSTEKPATEKPTTEKPATEKPGTTEIVDEGPDITFEEPSVDVDEEDDYDDVEEEDDQMVPDELDDNDPSDNTILVVIIVALVVLILSTLAVGYYCYGREDNSNTNTPPPQPYGAYQQRPHKQKLKRKRETRECPPIRSSRSSTTPNIRG